MPDSLEQRIRAAALAYPDLVALLGDGGSPPYFRWYEMQLVQASEFPAVVMFLVAGAPTYAAGGRLPTGYTRFQFTIWDTDLERAKQVEQVLMTFFDQLDLIGNPGQIAYPNRVVMQRSGMQPRSEPPQYWRILDASIFSNDQT